MKKLLVASFIALLSLTVAPVVFADGNCQPVYGGGQTCTSSAISLVKSVRNPQTNAFVHDLGINDPRYSPGSTATFQLTLTNTGSSQISSTTVSDTLPAFLTFLAGPGNFNTNTRTLTFTVTNLQPGQSQTFPISAQVASQSQLPANQGIVCIVNQAIATTSDGQSSQDNSQLCIQKVTTLPATGPEELPLLGLIPTGLFGYFLRKKAGK